MTNPLRAYTFSLSLIILLGCKPTVSTAVEPMTLRDGDIIFQTTPSKQSQAIQIVTHSPYSHVGIIFMREGKPYVYEAISKVQYTPLAQWIARDKQQHFVVKRLHNAQQVLTPNAIKKLKAQAITFKAKPYDLTFEWSDSRIYCSELVWKIYERALGIKVGKLQKLGDFDLSHPLVQYQLKQRYGNTVPLNNTVISPAGMFNADNLVMVTQH